MEKEVKSLFENHSKVLVIRGQSGTGKTYLIESNVPKNFHIQYYNTDNLHNDMGYQNFISNLKQKNSSTLKQIIVIDNVDILQPNIQKKLAEWITKREKDKKKGILQEHISIIFTADITYCKHLHNAFKLLKVIQLKLPTEYRKTCIIHEKLKQYHGKLTKSEIESISHQCQNYHTLISFMNLLIYELEILDKQKTNNDYKVKRESLINSAYKLDYTKCKNSFFNAVNEIRKSYKCQTVNQLWLNEKTIFDDFNEHDSYFLTEAIHAMLPKDVQNKVQLSNSLDLMILRDQKNLIEYPFLQDIFSELSIIHSEIPNIQNTKFNIADYSYPSVNKKNMDHLQSIKKVYHNHTMVNDFEFMEKLFFDFQIHQQWLTNWEIFNKENSSDLDENHCKKHNEEAINLLIRLRLKTPEDDQVSIPNKIKISGNFNRKEAAAKRQKKSP